MTMLAALFLLGLFLPFLVSAQNIASTSDIKRAPVMDINHAARFCALEAAKGE